MKTKILFSLAFLTLFSCKNQNTNDDNEKFVKQYFEYFNKHDWNKMANLYTEVAEFKDPSLGQGIVKQSRIQTIKKYTELARAFPDVNDKIVKIYSSAENHVIVEFISSGTAIDKSTFELPICTIFTIENGLISKDFTYYDNF
ncbi:hypothetical protein EMA8858_02124 [Emticicia aquatica]|jgi:ketosteroid isomerase-like protein|uniref:SnoaL-like domain-containing protein n=1 Tax=Emticicia aquatica TaxID=1681835 RepID=A0ABM9AQL8_9BACT|nr:nuclear transport factor 2 family protein [Emticicia aquatica]CAH0995996.1 hypothetical protein EMA8858_02124 [Emticicia aquatica]